MEPDIYFDRESPDYNFGMWGKPERLAANRCIICVMTEYGLCNNERMRASQVDSFIESIQMTIISSSNIRTRDKLKSGHVRKKHVTKPVTTIGPSSLDEHTAEGVSIEDAS